MLPALTPLPIASASEVQPPLSRRQDHAWRWYGALGLAATLGYFLLPSSDAQGVWQVLATISTALALLVGIRLHRPAHALPWYLLAAGMVINVLGGVASAVSAIGLTTAPFPSYADALFLGSYGVLLAGLLLVRPTRLHRGDIGIVVDTLIVTLGVGLIAWVYLIDPYVDKVDLPVLERVVSTAYPVMDVLLVAALARLWFAQGERNRSILFLSYGCGLLVLSDAAFIIASLNGTFAPSDPLVGGWLISQTLLGMAALHPSMRRLGEPGPARAPQLTRRRLLLLAGAALLAPIALIVESLRGQAIDIWVMAGASALLFILVVLRMGGLLRMLAAFNAQLGAEMAERDRAERALRESEERFRLLFEHSPDGILLIDPHDPSGTWPIVVCNDTVCRMNGYTREELIGQSVQVLNLDAAENAAPHDYLAALQRVGFMTVEATHRRKDGTLFPVETSTSLMTVGGRELILGIDRDITERVQAAQLLKESEERQRAQVALEQEYRQLQLVIDAAPVAISMFDNEMRYIAHSTQFLIDNGMPPESSLVGRSHYEVSPDIPERFRALDRRALNGETLSCLEDPTVWPDGNMTYLSWTLTPWHKLDGSIGGVVLVTQNIKELVEARESALAASRLKSEFLATMSHEIRTPMNGILGMTEILLGTPLTADQQDYAGVVRDSGQALLTLLNDILDFSKIEAGKLRLDPEEFAPQLLAEGAAAVLVAKAREKRIRLLADVAPTVPMRLRGDTGRLRQVLLNLLGNAVKFTAVGEVSLGVTVAAETPALVTLRFAVKDSGIGLSDRARGRLFQPFMQADGSTTRKYGGTGLGLAIAKQLVELMGGTIGVESVEGQGSTFWFIVPLQRADASDGVPAVPDIERPLLVQQTGGQGPGMPVVPPPSLSSDVMILVAEDNPVNRKVALLQLRKLGYQAEVVSNGREAVEAVAHSRYALVLMDCQMPELDGFAATREIRQIERWGGTRLAIVAMTANAMAGDREACVAAGMDDYLTKPVTTEGLRSVLERWLPVADAASAPSGKADSVVTT